MQSGTFDHLFHECNISEDRFQKFIKGVFIEHLLCIPDTDLGAGNTVEGKTSCPYIAPGAYIQVSKLNHGENHQVMSQKPPLSSNKRDSLFNSERSNEVPNESLKKAPPAELPDPSMPEKASSSPVPQTQGQRSINTQGSQGGRVHKGISQNEQHFLPKSKATVVYICFKN